MEIKLKLKICSCAVFCLSTFNVDACAHVSLMRIEVEEQSTPLESGMRVLHCSDPAAPTLHMHGMLATCAVSPVLLFFFFFLNVKVLSCSHLFTQFIRLLGRFAARG